MGQRFSKSVSSRLHAAFRKNERNLLKEASDEAAVRRAAAARGDHGGFTDPTASLSGFRRDRGEIWEVEKRQEEYLRQQNKNARGSAPESQGTEMSEDLLKFLNEAGPLERRVVKEFTSPKVYDALNDEEEERRLREKEAGLRRRRRMPLAERIGLGGEGGGEGAEGGDSDSPDGGGALSSSMRTEEERMALTVDRTTNFSVGEEVGEDPTVVRLRDLELLELLRAEIRSSSSAAATAAAAASSVAGGELPTVEEAAESYLRDLESAYPEGVESASGVRDDNLYLITNALKYGRVPVLMKEIESADYIGVWGHKVEELKKLQLRMVGEDEVRLGLDAVKRREEGEEDEAVDKALGARGNAKQEAEDRTRSRDEAARIGEEKTVAREKKASSPEQRNKRDSRKGSTTTGTAAFLEEERRRLQEQSEGGR